LPLVYKPLQFFAEEFDPSSAAPQITAENVAPFFDAAFDVQRQDHELTGPVVSVVYRGEVLFNGGYGWADLVEVCIVGFWFVARRFC